MQTIDEAKAHCRFVGAATFYTLYTFYTAKTATEKRQ